MPVDRGTESGENRDTDAGRPSPSEETAQSPKYVVVLDDARSNPSFDPGSNTWSDRQHGEYVVIRPGETPSGIVRADRPLRLRADYPHEATRPPNTTDYYPDLPPSAADRYSVRDKANPIPLFDGPPRRDQTAQGLVGDCGIVSTLGAVAGHRPEAIQNAIKQTGDGKFEVTLHKVDPATRRDPVARPTGDTVTYKMNDEIPVDLTDPHRAPVGMQAHDGCTWPALVEKAIACQDQTWDAKQMADWDRSWIVDKIDVDAERAAKYLPPSPNDAPLGYNRLDIGSTPYEQANLLAELTGKEADVRAIPNEQQGDQALLAEFRQQLSDGKPILVGTRLPTFAGELGPHSDRVFAFGHAYEVTKIDGDRIHLRNPMGVRPRLRAFDRSAADGREDLLGVLPAVQRQRDSHRLLQHSEMRTPMNAGRTVTITISKTILARVVDGERVVGRIAGSGHFDDQGRRFVTLGLIDETGDRDIRASEGDKFEFAGATWKVAEIYEPSTRPRGSVAELTRVPASGD